MSKDVEDKWMKRWEEEHAFEANPDLSIDKKFVTFPFPYMNGPLHIGHAFTSVRIDVYARFKRLQGFGVLFPWAWHWTGQPIVAAADRLSKKDPAMVREFVEIDKVPPQELSKFYDPKYMAQYYTDSGRSALKRLGLSIDWRREFHTTDLEPTFNKFVIWQYNRLRKMGYVTRGTHPVIWCPKDQSPTGDHDRVEGEGVTWEEYTLVLFRLEGEEEVYLPAATFRPETIFGVTNLWLNPEPEYVEISVDEKSKWIVSANAAEKLTDQLRKIKVLRRFPGKELIGKNVIHPLKREVKLVILPASFVDANNGTGVVYSVPAHAPMDYIALRDIQANPMQQKTFYLNPDVVASIRPIALISVPNMSDYPAQQIIEEMKIKDQTDPKVADATAEVYKKEFHQGSMNEITGKYLGKRVQQAKPLIIEELKELGVASAMYDLPEKVVCRCLTECRVKVLEDQWFLKYSDPEWKKLAHECVDQLEVYPDGARQWFHDVVDWIKDWPCARRVGLGTPLSWSPGWIVETLSDSTIYMAFYTIRGALNELGVGAESLSDEFFDYVFLGEGSKESLSKTSGIASTDLESMRNEFLYWYPVNLRNSAKELIPNHLLFFIFQHAAFFPKNQWPKGVSVNGMMTVEGEKMSKSKGNVISLRIALETYGADTLRAGLIDGAEGMDDLDWREKNARDIQSKIEALPQFISSLDNSGSRPEILHEPDLWLENRVQNHILNIAKNLDTMKTKSAFQEVFYSYWNDIRYYLLRTEVHSSVLVKYVVDTWIKLLSIFIPYTAEELYSTRGNTKLVSTSQYPEFDSSKVHPEAELGEILLQNLINDCRSVLKLMPQKMNSLHLYIAPKWAFDLFKQIVDNRKKNVKMSETLQEFFSSHPTVDRKESANAANKIMKTINDLGENFLSSYRQSEDIDEATVYSDAEAYLGRTLGVSVKICTSDSEKYDPKNKARFALPFKPAIYLE